MYFFKSLIRMPFFSSRIYLILTAIFFINLLDVVNAETVASAQEEELIRQELERIIAENPNEAEKANIQLALKILGFVLNWDSQFAGDPERFKRANSSTLRKAIRYLDKINSFPQPVRVALAERRVAAILELKNVINTCNSYEDKSDTTASSLWEEAAQTHRTIFGDSLYQVGWYRKAAKCAPTNEGRVRLPAFTSSVLAVTAAMKPAKSVVVPWRS